MSTKMGSVEEQKDQQHKEAAADAPLTVSQERHPLFSLAKAVHNGHADQDDDHHHQGDGGAQPWGL